MDRNIEIEIARLHEANQANAFGLEAHERECRAMRRSQEQWQESATAILNQFRADLNKGVASWNKFIMSTLIGLLSMTTGMTVWLLVHFVIK